MKNAVRLIVLMLGLVTTYVALAAPMLPAPDGGPIPTCNPQLECGSGRTRASNQGNLAVTREWGQEELFLRLPERCVQFSWRVERRLTSRICAQNGHALSGCNPRQIWNAFRECGRHVLSDRLVA